MTKEEDLQVNENTGEDDDTEVSNIGINFDVSIKMSGFIVLWAIAILTYFIVVIPYYGFSTLFYDSAIVVGAALILLIVYEYSIGNRFTLPKLDYKKTTDLMIRVIGFILAIQIFVVFVLTGILMMIDLQPATVFASASLITIGAAVGLLGLNFVKPLLLKKHQKE